MACPNCPGPKVPHRCGRKLSEFEQLAASFAGKSRRRPVPVQRAVPPPKNTEAWMPAAAARNFASAHSAMVAAPVVSAATSSEAKGAAARSRSPSIGSAIEAVALTLLASCVDVATLEADPTPFAPAIKLSPRVAEAEEATSSVATCDVEQASLGGDMDAAVSASSQTDAETAAPSVGTLKLVFSDTSPMPCSSKSSSSGGPTGASPVPALPARSIRFAAALPAPVVVPPRSGVCRNCPGPKVPHRCGKIPSLMDQINAMKHGRGGQRLEPTMSRPVAALADPLSPAPAPFQAHAATFVTRGSALVPDLRPATETSSTEQACQQCAEVVAATVAAVLEESQVVAELSPELALEVEQVVEASTADKNISAQLTPEVKTDSTPMCSSCGRNPVAVASCRTCSGKGAVDCSRCSSSGRFVPPCRACDGSGVGRSYKFQCHVCKGKGKVDRGTCNGCQGDGARKCFTCQGSGVPPCEPCIEMNKQSRMQQAQQREQGPPPPGVSISKCGDGELSTLQSLWSDRGGSGAVEAAWIVDNPLLAHFYHERRKDLKSELRREPDELQGFHGTRPDSVLSIAQTGFDAGRRSGQAFGAGEYFAKNPSVSEGYCHGGRYMFVCRLCLGHQSSTSANKDGDHIWVPDQQYYVISQPDQILPQYIIRFCSYRSNGEVPSPELSRALSLPWWSTKIERQVTHVPANRPCVMSMPSTNALWMGYLHANVEDRQLEADIRAFFATHAPKFAPGLRVHIASGKYKKAHVQLQEAIPKDLVHRLNRLPILEAGTERRICVDDAHGSPEQECPRWIAGFCRGRNLRFTHSCWCKHKDRPTEKAIYRLVEVDLWGAKGTEIMDKFMQSTPFHDGGHPYVVAIHAVQNDTLAKLHEEYRAYLRNKNKEEPSVRELYHGTNNKIVDVLFKHGLQPPSDFQASDRCPVSGGKGLCTSLCNNDCKHCVERHYWDKCHMFGLGIYLADLSQKSHRYCSQPELLPNGRRRFRMVLCSVLGRALEVAGHLKYKEAMHDVCNVRAVGDELKDMLEPHCCSVPSKHAVEGADLLAVKGLGGAVRPGYSVVNSEYIAYHPYQCLPKYQITYEV